MLKKILITKLNNHLENIVPKKFREINNKNIWVEKKHLRYGIIITAHIIPFSIKCNNWEELEKYFVRKFKTSSDKSIFINIKSVLIKTKEDLEAFFYMYGDVFDSKMFREFYILDYNIQKCEYKLEENDTLDYEIYAENVKNVIDVLDKMRNLILKKYVIQNMKGAKLIET